MSITSDLHWLLRFYNLWLPFCDAYTMCVSYHCKVYSIEVMFGLSWCVSQDVSTCACGHIFLKLAFLLSSTSYTFDPRWALLIFLVMQSCWCDYLLLAIICVCLRCSLDSFIAILCFFIVQVFVKHSDCFSGVCMLLSCVSNAYLEWYYADYSCVY